MIYQKINSRFSGYKDKYIQETVERKLYESNWIKECRWFFHSRTWFFSHHCFGTIGSLFPIIKSTTFLFVSVEKNNGLYSGTDFKATKTTSNTTKPTSTTTKTTSTTTNTTSTTTKTTSCMRTIEVACRIVELDWRVLSLKI